MTDIKNKKVLVTGSSGFIGSHLAEELVASGAKVRAFVHYNSRNSFGNLELLDPDIFRSLEIITGDISDPFFVEKAVSGCDIVFHLAALIAIPYSYIAPRCYVETNISGTLNIMEACRKRGVEKIVHTSTSETYGTAIYTPIDEKHPLQGQSPYSASKIGADKIAEAFHLSFNLPVSTIRPFNTYGPRQSARAVIPTIISQALAGDDIKLGSLDPVRDFTYVKDTVSGFIAIARSEETVGRVTNIGTGKAVSIGDLADTIIRIMGGKKRIVSDGKRVRPEKSEVMQLLCDNGKAAELTGWRPATRLEDGLAETIEFVRAHPELYKTDIYNI
ncbi:MAG: SDR family NAD(P)-dependent oxidoreductase [Spirochaetales bacterium]|nr:SDR family NAD(P)-dependent oxidoreductase [Spirochaetales bacterium]